MGNAYFTQQNKNKKQKTKKNMHIEYTKYICHLDPIKLNIW